MDLPVENTSAEQFATVFRTIGVILPVEVCDEDPGTIRDAEDALVCVVEQALCSEHDAARREATHA